MPRLPWALTVVLTAAAAIRVGHWWTVREAPFVAWLTMDSQEYDRWGRALAAGGWLGSEAYFQAPLYPYLIGALYTMTGPRLAAVYLMQIAVAVVGLYALYRCGRELEGPTLGIGAAALMAASGILVFHDVQLLKESLATSVMALLLWSLLAARGKGRWLGWALTGVLLGLLAGLRENALLLLPLVMVVPWLPGAVSGRGRRAAAASAWLLAGTLSTLVPSAARNYALTGELLVTTYQGGVNFYIGNHPGADGTYRPLVPGKQVPALERQEPVRLAQAAEGRALSPGEVSRFWLRQSLSWAAAEPATFGLLQLRKLALFWRFYEQPDAVDYYWMRQRSPALRLAVVEFGALALLGVVGLWLVRRRQKLWAPVLLVSAGWMVATVAFFIFSRYRLPVIPALALLAAVPLARLVELALRGSQGVRVAAGVAGVTLALLLPHLLGYEPRLDLVHYNLGRIEEERGRTSVAADHYRRALAANPGDFLSLMNLGNLAARGGDLVQAREYFRRALAIEPGSDDLWANLGGAHLGLGELAAAETALGRALALNPFHLHALHNRALVFERQRDLELARQWNRRVLELDPTFQPARRQQERLRGEMGSLWQREEGLGPRR